MVGLSPNPGVSYLFQNQTRVSPANEALGGSASDKSTNSDTIVTWTTFFVEGYLDVFARNCIKDELGLLDPFLHKVGGWSPGGPVGAGDEARRAINDYCQIVLARSTLYDCK